LPRCFLVAASFRRSDNNTIGAMYRRVAEEWAAAGHRVILVNDGRRPEEEAFDGRLVFRSWPSVRPTGLADFRFLRGLLAQYRPDCLISNYGADNVCQLAGWLAKVPCRVVWHHTPTSQDKLDFGKSSLQHRWLVARKRWLYRLPTNFVCGSTHTREDLLRTFGVPEQKISLRRYLLPDPQRAAKAAEKRDPFRILFTGRFHPSKGHEFLIRALPRLAAAFPALEVDFVGEGPIRTEIEALARRLGVEKHCRFHGQVKHLHTVFEMAGRSALAVAPSLDEGFGLILIEAMGMGTPVVASDIPPFRGILTPGEDSLLAPPGDVEALGDALHRLLGDPALRQRLGEGARENFLAKFSTERNAADQAAFFEDLIPAR
jgi:colanic acid/amylovoran biosynthesis glycosyltransferase